MTQKVFIIIVVIVIIPILAGLVGYFAVVKKSERPTPVPVLKSKLTISESLEEFSRTQAEETWDALVLGRIDANWLSQFGPSPHVSYTQVLSGTIPNGQAQGQLTLREVAEKLLPEGGVPIYQSQQEEIVFLKQVVVPGYEDTEVYKVIDTKEATPENLIPYQVLLATNKQEYQQGEEIIVTLTNNLDMSITTTDQRTDCSIITLELYAGDEWEKVRNCFSAAPAVPVTLKPHSEKTAKLLGISPGMFRASIEFSPGVSFSFRNLFVVSSPSFRILETKIAPQPATPSQNYPTCPPGFMVVCEGGLCDCFEK